MVYWFIGIAFDRIIDNRTLRLITESSDSSPKTEKDGSLRGNYVLLLDIMLQIYIIKLSFFMVLVLYHT